MDPKALGQFLMQPSTADVLNTPVRRGGILPVTEYPNRTEFDLSSGLTGALWNAITAPARAARGEISEDQQIPEAFNFAGSLTLGSLLAPRPTGSVGMGGRAAKGALDMSEAARMARAKEMGFDTENRLYHGFTGDKTDEFSGPTWLAHSSDVAQSYADEMSGDVGQFLVRSKNPYRIASGDEAKEFWSKWPRLGDESFKDRQLRIYGELQKQGYDSLEVKPSAFDGDVGYEWAAGTWGEPQTVIFDPTNIRSVNAAFDPEKAHLANILAANAKTGAAVPLATKALEAQQPQGIRAFHGSPHDFERFSMEHIGKGEGAQAYGHGLYFAETEDVAKAYRDALAKLPEPDAQAMQGVQGKLAEIDAQIAEYAPYAARSPAMQRQIDLLNDSRDALLRQAAEETQTRAPSGHMYEVNIKADLQDFLDWDKPRDKLAPKVQEWVRANHPDVWEKAADGSSLYQLLQNKLMKRVNMFDPRPQTGVGVGGASQSLREAGIPGIRYLDQMSRGAGEGSSNYVVFDDNLIEILRKYGLLGPVAGGGTLAGMLMGGQDGETY